jgi:hypothetical protein
VDHIDAIMHFCTPRPRESLAKSEKFLKLLDRLDDSISPISVTVQYTYHLQIQPFKLLHKELPELHKYERSMFFEELTFNLNMFWERTI